MNKIKEKIIPAFIIGTTVILAMVAVFTATKLYRLRNQGIEEPKAWDCSKYTFNVEASGIVTVANLSSRNEPEQQAKVYVNGAQVSTLNVPALAAGQQATQIGTVSVPSEGVFTWEVKGTRDCGNNGQHQLTQTSCSTFAFSLTTSSPSPSPTGSPLPQTAKCSEVKAYDEDWNLLTSNDMTKLKEGDIVRFAVYGEAASGTFDMAEFTINGDIKDPVTQKKPGSDEFYIEYTIPAQTYSFDVYGKVHHLELDVWI